MSLVSNIAPTNVNHPANQPLRPAQNQHQQPSVQNAKGRLNPTQIEEASQLSGNHTQVQKLDAQQASTNPLTSPQQFNAKIAATRF